MVWIVKVKSCDLEISQATHFDNIFKTRTIIINTGVSEFGQKHQYMCMDVRFGLQLGQIGNEQKAVLKRLMICPIWCQSGSIGGQL